MKRFLLTSIFIHFLPLAILYEVPPENSSLENKKIQNIKFIHKIPSSKKMKGHGSKNQKFSLSDFAVGSGNSRHFESSHYFDHIGQVGDKSVAKDSDNPRRINVYHRLYSMITKEFIYPSIFQDNKIYGMVKTRVVFDKNGIYQHNKLKIEGNSLYLKKLVTKTLVKIFSKAISIEKDLFFSNFFTVDMFFYFTPPNTQGIDESFSLMTIREGALSFLFKNTHARKLDDFGKDYVNTVSASESVDFGAFYTFIDDLITDRKKVKEIYYKTKMEEYLRD